MIDQLDELYRDVILDHFRSPRNTGELPDATIRAEGSNPLCGDEMSMTLKIQGDRIEAIRFQGKGCAISQATASMLTEHLAGKRLAEAARVIERMKQLMQGVPPSEEEDLGDLESLAGVRKFPVRVKCAALSWNVLEQGIAEYHKKG